MLWISRDKYCDHIKLWAEEPEIDKDSEFGEFGIPGHLCWSDNYIYHWHDDKLLGKFGIKIEKGHKKRINMTES